MIFVAERGRLLTFVYFAAAFIRRAGREAQRFIFAATRLVTAPIRLVIYICSYPLRVGAIGAVTLAFVLVPAVREGCAYVGLWWFISWIW